LGVSEVFKINWGKKVGIDNHASSTFSESNPHKAQHQSESEDFSDGDPFPTFLSQTLFDSSCDSPHFTLCRASEWEEPCVVGGNFCQHLDVGACFMQAASWLVIPTVFQLTRTPHHPLFSDDFHHRPMASQSGIN
jgi:hypothetical protein